MPTPQTTKQPEESFFDFIPNPITWLKDLDAKLSQYNAYRAIDNMFRNPIAGAIDNIAYAANLLGVPTSPINSIRAINAILPYRLSSGVRAAYRTLMNDKSYRENFYDAVAEPTRLEDEFTIRPLTVTNDAFTDEENKIIKQLAGNDQRITAKDYKAAHNHYLSPTDGLLSYFTHDDPLKVVEYAIGQAGGGNGYVTDTYDLNTQSAGAKRDTKMYERRSIEDLTNGDIKSLSYSLPRALSPYILPLDVMPDAYKVNTKIDLNQIP